MVSPRPSSTRRPSSGTSSCPMKWRIVHLQTVRVLAYGLPSRVWTLPVAPTAPAIFTVSASGIGQGAILNQDNTVNSLTNPAPAGTIIQIFATGGGQSNPPAATGSVTPVTGGGGNELPVKVFFADDQKSVVFAGPAPGFASGALQINAVVPHFGRATENKTLRLHSKSMESAPPRWTSPSADRPASEHSILL
jgi:uncharacterized protein (TIGR03437 family)